MGKYKISQISALSGLTERTIRYYEEEKIITPERTSGGQRIYKDEHLVYLKRVTELKKLGFQLSEIKKIFELKRSDENGSKRRAELIAAYKAKLDDDKRKLERLNSHISELEWHLHQLEKAEDGFTECPGALCVSCEYKARCTFFRSEGQ